MSAMSSGLRKFTLTAHTTSSVGFLGAVGAFIAIACAGLASQHMPLVRAAYLAMELIALVRHRAARGLAHYWRNDRPRSRSALCAMTAIDFPMMASHKVAQ